MSPAAAAAAPDVAPAAAPASGPASYQSIEIGRIVESTTNPRKRFDEASLAELALSIQEQGIIEPLIVRKKGIGVFELVAGARRLRAAKIAHLADVPCLVRDLSDRQALELQITENLQRKDIHPLEEADGYAALQKADKAYTIEAVAQRVGRTAAYIKSRLKFLALTPDVRTAFEEDQITAAHAAVLTKVPAKLQKAGLARCFYRLFQEDDAAKALALQPVRELELWYRDTVVVDVAAPDTQEMFPELVETAKAVKAAGGVLVPITHSYYLDTVERKLKPAPLTSQEWREVKGKATCAHVQTGVVVLGRGRAETVQICTTKTCATHWPERQPPKATKGTTTARSSNPAMSKWQKDQRDRQAKERKLANALARVRPQACQQLLAKFQGKPLTDEVVQWLIGQVTPQALNATIEGALGPRKTWTPARATALILFCHALQRSYSAHHVATALKKYGVDVLKLAAKGTVKATPKATTKAKSKRQKATTGTRGRKARG